MEDTTEKTHITSPTPEELSDRPPSSTDSKEDDEVQYVGHLKFSLIFIGLCLSVFQVALVCTFSQARNRLARVLTTLGRGCFRNRRQDHHR